LRISYKIDVSSVTVALGLGIEPLGLESTLSEDLEKAWMVCYTIGGRYDLIGADYKQRIISCPTDRCKELFGADGNLNIGLGGQPFNTWIVVSQRRFEDHPEKI
jgi:hypothetical protein